MSEYSKVSIIIPTYNRGERILSVLESLEKQVYNDFEVIIVNDGSTDNTKEVLTTRLDKFDLNIRVVNQDNGGRAKVRNRGADEAFGQLLIFMDDDIRHNDDAIQLHINHHSKLPNSILVGNALEDPKLAKTDIQRYKVVISRKWSDNLASNKGPLDISNLYLTAANFSIPKFLFHKLGGFDQSLTDAEDYDLAMRAYELNIPIYFDPQIIGWHDDFITCASYVKRQQQYLNIHKQLKELKPQLYNKFSRNPDKISNSKKYIYKLLKGDLWIDLVDSNKLKFLPLKIRYKLYSAIIYANSRIL